MSRPVQKIILLMVAALALVACNSLKPKKVEKSKHDLGGAYSGTLSKNSAFLISPNKVVAVKTIPKAQQAEAPGLTEFKTNLYPKLKTYCGQCHAGQNAVPFVSPGLDLAYTTVKKFIAKDPEQSQIIKNVRASHNGVTPAWADELAPLVNAVADKQ